MISPRPTERTIPKGRFVMNGLARPYAFLEYAYPTLQTDRFDALLGVIDEAELDRAPR